MASTAHHIDNVESVNNTTDVSQAKALIHDAKDATDQEHQLAFFKAVRLYPKAIGWSILLSAALIMEGYDLVLMGSFYAVPSFAKKYGHRLPDGTYQLTAAWQSGLSNGASVGSILGLFLNGIISERYGYKKTIIGALVLISALVFIPFFAQNVETLLVGQIFMGIPWGVFQTLTTVYASEVCPTQLRGYLTTYVNMCWIFGQLTASGVLRALVSRPDEWAYRIPFALQWIWPVPLIIAISFAPESPWWLVRRGKYDEARNSLKRLTSKSADPEFDEHKTVAMMIHTVEMEREIGTGMTYLDCFRGTDLRRTEIACAVWSIQTLSGSGFRSYSTYFFTQAGLPATQAFNFAIGQYSLGIFGVICSWFIMPRLGRRSLFMYGLALMGICLFIIGCLGLAPDSNSGAKWGVASLALVYVYFYDTTVGPVTYSLVAEIPATSLRTRTIVLARISYNVLNIASNVITPYMFNPTAWNLKSKSGFIWAGICAVCLVWIFFRLPEPQGRTFGELDILFERKVKARDFKTAVIEPLDSGTEEGLVEGKHEKM
jgi:SP family general alpha glucoside:H+ symporter-like MFS transporter